MATVKQKYDQEPWTGKVIKKEIVYVQESFLGLLGWWRKVRETTLGETIEIHLRHSLYEYDRLVINGVEVPIPKEVIKKEL